MPKRRFLIASTRALIRSHAPAWMNVDLDRDFLKNLRAALRTQEPTKTPALNPQKGRPHWRRISQVFQILDEATKEGMVSYTTLINCVREATGKGCSRKLISKWKLERGLR